METTVYNVSYNNTSVICSDMFEHDEWFDWNGW